MKKKTILAMAILFLISLSLAACGAGNSDEPTSAPEPTTAEAETPEQELAAPAEASIAGTWIYAYSELDDGTPWTFQSDVWLEITSNTIRIHDGDIVHEGALSEIAAYNFLISDKISTTDGERDPAFLVDSYLLYDPSTGLLRHTGVFSANEGLNQIHLFFTRG